MGWVTAVRIGACMCQRPRNGASNAGDGRALVLPAPRQLTLSDSSVSRHNCERQFTPGYVRLHYCHEDGILFAFAFSTRSDG